MSGLLGAEDFGKGMTSVNKSMKENATFWNEFGRGIREFATAKWFTSMFPNMVQISAQEKINSNLTKQLTVEKEIVREKNKQNKETSAAILMTKAQAEEVEDLLLQYEKATPTEKPSIRRKIELSQMSEQNQVYAFSTSQEDRALLLEMTSKLTDSVKQAMAGVVSYEQGIYTQGRFSPFLNSPTSGGLAKPGEKLTNVTNYGAEEINIDVHDFSTLVGMASSEEQLNIILKQIKEAMLKDPEWIKNMSKKTIKSMPEK
jgi:hypothetical protein